MEDYSNQPRKISFSFNDVAQYLVVLFIAKFFKSFGIYLCYDLLKQIHLVQLLFFSFLFASIFFLLLQNPFNSIASKAKSSSTASSSPAITSNKPLNKFQYYRIAKYSLVQVLIYLLWLFGLTQCGPLRTTLIFEQSEIVVLCALKAIFLNQTNPSRTRAVIILLTATIILFAFDNDDYRRNVHSGEDHPEGSHHGIISHIFYFFISWFDVSDHKAGVILLLTALLLRVAFNQSSLTRVVTTEVGGSKRLRALSVCFSTVILAPWAFFNLFSSALDPSSYAVFSSSSEDSMAAQVQHSWIYYFVPILAMALFLFVIDFYVESYASQKTDANYSSKYASIFVFSTSIGLSFVWNHPHLVKVIVMDKMKTIVEQEHALSWAVIISYFLYVLATNMLSNPISKHKGSFIGYSSVGSPLYSLTGESLKRTSMSMVTVVKNIIREIVSHKDSRSIFYFLCLNLVFTFVELTYGTFSNSLGLISDGVHMLFDCSALVMGLFAAVASQWKSSKIYSYGYGRIEILSGFVNGLFLVVISLFVFIEGVTRLFEPPEIKSAKIIYVSFAGLCVNLFGIFAFRHAHSHGGIAGSSHNHSHHNHSHDSHSHESHGHNHSHSHSHSSCSSQSESIDNDNMQGVFLHVLADTLGSVGVIISSFLIQQFGWYIADPVCSICIAVMIFISVMPLLRHSSSLLLLKTPTDKESSFKSALQRILNVEGVLSYRDEHLWQLSSNSQVATLHVQISSNAYEQLISAQISSILREMKLSNLTVQIEKESFFHHLHGLGASMGQIDDSKKVYRISDVTTSENTTFINVEKFV